jgi:hypothetical protein
MNPTYRLTVDLTTAEYTEVRIAVLSQLDVLKKAVRFRSAKHVAELVRERAELATAADKLEAALNKAILDSVKTRADSWGAEMQRDVSRD